MKLPNNYGSIYKKGGNRRKPYAVVVTTGWTDEGKQKRKVLGYVASPAQGLKLLAEYHNNPYNLNIKNISFSDIWKDVEVELEKMVEQGTMSSSNLDSLKFAFYNHCQSIHNEKMLDLKFKTMQNMIDNAKNKNNGNELGVSAKGFIKTVCVKVFNYAIIEYELPLLKNTAVNLKCGVKKKSQKHIPFSEQELSTLWGMQHLDIIKVLLIYCYTGVRPNELFITKKCDIFIDKEYFITGSKTEAGKNRIIPIHPKINHLIKYFYDHDCDYPFTIIYSNFNYAKVKREFSKLMDELQMNHTPYDGRHTFITMMKKAGANDYILKRIVGHSIKDITENVYTHREVSDLINEVKKIK